MLGKYFQNLFTRDGVWRNLSRRNKKVIYLDHAATTPIDDEVYQVMTTTLKNNYANPGGIHHLGVMTKQLIHESRRSVARHLGTTSDHIVFTRGGTESNNLALQGVITHTLQKLREDSFLSGIAKPHVVSSLIEHAAVLETLKALKQQQVIDLTLVEVDADGRVLVDHIKEALRPETVLVSVMYVNNEIGTIQPIREIAKLIRWYRKQQDRKQVGAYPLFHVDAIQAVNYLDLHVERLGVDLMSLSGSKMYGPKSSGVLYVRHRSLLAPLLFGGDQELGIRPGTEDVVQVVGFAKALDRARAVADYERERLETLRNEAIVSLEKNIKHIVINGSRTERIANNISFTIPGISGERLVIELDARGICCASKSACKEENGEASHVLTALRRANPTLMKEKKSASAQTAVQITDTDGAVRLSLGQSTTRADMRTVVESITEIVRAIRSFEKTIYEK